MEQQRLNHLLLLHVNKDLSDSLSCVAVANSFVGDSDTVRMFLVVFNTTTKVHLRLL